MTRILTGSIFEKSWEVEAIRFLRGEAAEKLRPFVGADTSAGMEYELQVAVEGSNSDVDLPIVIRDSNFYRNTAKRALRGDLAPDRIEVLDEFLDNNNSEVWENSWVRLPRRVLGSATGKLLDSDLHADKSDPGRGLRTDLHRFHCHHRGEPMLRLPVSYLLKLSLASILEQQPELPEPIKKTGKKLLQHMVSDNTSPEILSFTIPRATTHSVGTLAARETARTLLVCQLLVQYANTAFGLEESGQKCLIYFAPHAPSRQKYLNDIVPDGYYRHLFMSPCLSGWDRGEEKHRYMALCHRTLSRSQLNTIGKLKDAGIITNNLVTLPNTSNTCLANNGIHVSLGSLQLSRLAGRSGNGFTPPVEKYIGDLVIKIVEHFLPLFVGTYSAAPYRIDFRDFHPENVLGFLPHELDFTHLRMIWRRWKKKADLRVLGRPLTPFGPRWLDTTLATILRLKGDMVVDFRLIDYLVTLLSTDSSPALDGAQGNQEKLREELMEMGVFDSRMSMYLLYRQRLTAASGYSGFEGRSYSLFHSLLGDMSEAVDVQNLITALAYRYVLQEKVCHRDIPDTPSVESERRQVFFGSAIGLPTFFVRSETGNRFMRKILSGVSGARKSNRYRGYLRVRNSEYRLALLKLLRRDGADLIRDLGMDNTLKSLERRLHDQSQSAYSAIVEGVRKNMPHRKSPLSLTAEQFNSAAEEYFRGKLKRSHMREGIEVMMEECAGIDRSDNPEIVDLLRHVAPDGAEKFLKKYNRQFLEEKAEAGTVVRMVCLCLASIHTNNKIEVM